MPKITRPIQKRLDALVLDRNFAGALASSHTIIIKQNAGTSEARVNALDQMTTQL